MSTQVLGINETGDMSVVHLAEEADVFNNGDAIVAGNLVYISPLGVADPADRTLGYPAMGFALESAAVGTNVKVWRTSQLLTGLTGLVTGKMYYLNESGGVSDTPPAFGSGHLMQKIGIAASATSITFAPQPAVLYS